VLSIGEQFPDFVLELPDSMERDKENLVTQSGHSSHIEFVWQWGIAWLLQSDRNGKPCDFFLGQPHIPLVIKFQSMAGMGSQWQ